ncbi:MAG: VOC family protein [Atribacterota bacterium]|nr:VOC family protein [Atribacterota bacterium]
MIKKIDHIGMAVQDIEKILKAFSKALQIPVPEIKDNKEMKIKSAMIELDGVGIEILQAYGESGRLVDYVKKNGNGIHHICFQTDNVEQDMNELEDSGFSFSLAKPIIGVRGKRCITTTDEALEGIPFEISEP